MICKICHLNETNSTSGMCKKDLEDFSNFWWDYDIKNVYHFDGFRLCGEDGFKETYDKIKVN